MIGRFGWMRNIIVQDTVIYDSPLNVRRRILHGKRVDIQYGLVRDTISGAREELSVYWSIDFENESITVFQLSTFSLFKL
jgi:hypothetical protein